MRLKEVLVFWVVIAALALTACSTVQPQDSYHVTPYTEKNLVTVTVEELQQYQHVYSEMVVFLGDRFSVILASTPSTGFGWVLASDPARLMQIGHQTLETVTTTPPTLGSGGQEIWTFEALEKGKTIVSLEYSQPWEGGEKGEWTFELTVTVK